MTLDEAIEYEKESLQHCKRMLEEIYEDNLENKILKFEVKQHEQLAEWLEELKELRKIKEDYAKGMQTSYATFMYKKAIDDFVEALQKKIEKDLANPDLALECKKCGIWKNYDIAEISEQLKAGVTND